MAEYITELKGIHWRFVTCHRCHGAGFRMREYAGDLNKPGARAGGFAFRNKHKGIQFIQRRDENGRGGTIWRVA